MIFIAVKKEGHRESTKEVSFFETKLKARAKGQRLVFYAKFSARLNVPRSFWIFSCNSVMA